jgi:hypothetical protein
MRKVIPILLLLFILPSCRREEVKDIIKDNHVIHNVVAKRIRSDKKPSYEELEQMVLTSTSAWESMDRIYNGWKPGSMESVDPDGKPRK